MKKLFLASFAHQTLENVRELLPKEPKDLTVAFIPTAADPYEDKHFVDVDRAKLVAMGFTVFDLDIKDKTESELETLLEPADVVFVAGGNMYYLLDHARKSGFMSVIKKLVERGVVYVGSSAGAVLACPTVDTARLFDPTSAAPDLTSFEGLGLVDFLILPHAGAERYLERMQKTVEEWTGRGYQVHALTDQQAIVVNGDVCTLVNATEQI